jgi:ABC-type branched-subunit amino acid transport system permease subunit
MSLRTVLGILLVVNGYVLIYYRLLVRHFYQEQQGVKESTFGALFSFPPYQRLPELGKKYARRYWVTLALLVIVLLVSAFVKDSAT